jgi:TatD DNase family protein
MTSPTLPDLPRLPDLVDSHCHLDFPDLVEETAEIITRARAAGVNRIVTICTRLKNEPKVRAMAGAHPEVFYAAGIHPMSAHEEPPVTVDQLVAFARHPRFVGIGETGLEPYTCVMHCFSSGPRLAEAALEMGFTLSISGIAAFPKSQALRDIFAKTPLDRLILETDSPYLAPPPFRGKRNEPAYVAHTARALAPLFGLSLEDFAAQTTANFDRLFPRAARPAKAA